MSNVSVWLIQHIGRKPAIALMALFWMWLIATGAVLALGLIIAITAIAIGTFGELGTFLVALSVTVLWILYHHFQEVYPEQKKVKDE